MLVFSYYSPLLIEFHVGKYERIPQTGTKVKDIKIFCFCLAQLSYIIQEPLKNRHTHINYQWIKCSTGLYKDQYSGRIFSIKIPSSKILLTKVKLVRTEINLHVHCQKNEKKIWHIYTMVYFPSRKKTENENWNLKNGNDKNDIKWGDWGPETCTLHGFSHMCIPSPNLLLYVFN